MTESTEVAKVESALPALPAPEQLKEVFRDNLEGIQASFEMIKIPAAGSTIWEVPGDSGEAEPMKELVGVILTHYPVRAYWDRPMGDGSGGVPPTCSSLNAKTGSLPRNENGEFGECASCRWSQFGTAVKNGQAQRGQACSFKHRVFLLMSERGFLPYMIVLATTSATKKYDGSLSTYAVKLSGKMKKLSDVLTKIKLVKDRNADGIEYAKAQFFMAGDLNEEDKTKVDFLKKNLESLMRSKPLDMEEAAAEESATANGKTDVDPWDK